MTTPQKPETAMRREMSNTITMPDIKPDTVISKLEEVLPNVGFKNGVLHQAYKVISYCSDAQYTRMEIEWRKVEEV